MDYSQKSLHHYFPSSTEQKHPKSNVYSASNFLLEGLLLWQLSGLKSSLYINYFLLINCLFFVLIITKYL